MTALPTKAAFVSELENLKNEIAVHMDEIKDLFKPGAKITVLVRCPDDPDGRKDFMMTDDEPQEVINMISRRTGLHP